MFKRLRNRFMALHMGVVALMLTVFFGSVLLISYTNMERATDMRLDVLWRARVPAGGTEADGQPSGGPPFAARFREGEASEDAPASGAETAGARPNRIASQTQGSPGGAALPGGMALRMGDAIFIFTDEDRAVASVESPYGGVDEAFYQSAADAVRLAQYDTGRVRVNDVSLKYKREGDALLLIDVTPEADSFNAMLMSFLMIMLPTLVFVTLCSLYFANRAIRPIEAGFERQKMFIADASHELKTPLAAIGANLDMAEATAAPEQGKWLGYIRDELGRMTALTSGLLYMTKMDGGAKSADAGHLPVNLSALAGDVWLPLEAVFFEKGIAAEARLEPDVTVPGDAEQLRRLVSILADNAARYAGKRASVSLLRVRDTAVLEFSNDGAGIPAGEMERIWQRFYRGDHARVYDGGYGLGLPMARAIVEAHRGKIGCESRPGEETVFTVRLNCVNSNGFRPRALP